MSKNSVDFEPTDADRALARELIEDGWMSISCKYRQVARFTKAWPTAQELLQPVWLHTLPGRIAATMWTAKSRSTYLRERSLRPEFVEVRDLTIGEFRAFKQADGEVA